MPRCLIVDDAGIIRKVARCMLEDMRYEVTEAENGQEAIERLRASAADVVLLDWQLPVMGALEFLAAVSALR